MMMGLEEYLDWIIETTESWYQDGGELDSEEPLVRIGAYGEQYGMIRCAKLIKDFLNKPDRLEQSLAGLSDPDFKITPTQTPLLDRKEDAE